MEEWFIFILLQHHSLWKQEMENQSFQKIPPLHSVKNMPKHVSVRAAKFKTEVLYETRSKAYYDLWKL